MASSSIVGSPCLSTSGCWTGKCYLLIYWCYCWCLRYIVIVIIVVLLLLFTMPFNKQKFNKKFYLLMLVLLLLFIMPFYKRMLIAEQCFCLCWCFFLRAVLKVNEASFVFVFSTRDDEKIFLSVLALIYTEIHLWSFVVKRNPSGSWQWRISSQLILSFITPWSG